VTKRSGMRRPTETARDPTGPWSSEIAAHQDALRAYFARRLRSVGDLDDHVQEVFERILATRTERAHVDNWPAFMRRVASNVLIDRFRHDRSRMSDRHVPIENADAVTDDGIGAPDRIASGRQQLQLLQSAIDDLDPLCRAAFRLVRIDGLSHKEAAEELGVPSATIGRQIEKALGKLTKAMIKCA
jgi:RNA polymerase sigma factor (sigma-70 family)